MSINEHKDFQSYGYMPGENLWNDHEVGNNYIQSGSRSWIPRNNPTFSNEREEFYRDSSRSRQSNADSGTYRNHHKIKSPTFDGQSHKWQYFKRLFLNAATIYHWTEEERLYNLLNAMKDEAKSFTVSIESQLSSLSFNGLMAVMEHRIGAGSGSPHYQSLLES